MSRLLVVAFKGSDVTQIEGFAKELGFAFDIALLDSSQTVSSDAEKVYMVADGDQLTADALAGPLSELVESYTHVAAISSMASKDLLPRIAAKADGAMVTDVVKILGPTQFLRPVQAGAVLATVETLASPVVLTVRPAGFGKAVSTASPTSETLSIAASTRSKIVGSTSQSGSRPDLAQAKVVVSGGRPLKDADTFERVIGGFADSLGGAVGATRAAVDSGIAPNETQVGQTGKIVAPNLYIAAGISGSTQHMAGIKDSKLIVAINKDPDAPIFATADLGIVGDLFDVIPQLQDALKGLAS